MRQLARATQRAALAGRTLTPQGDVLPTAQSAPIAEQIGLAHDAGNLLGALRLYSDLLRAPGVLRPEHQHYATELGMIAARSSSLIGRLLATGTLAAPCVVAGDALCVDAPPHRAEPANVLRSLLPVLERIAAGAATVSLAAEASLPTLHLPAEALERIAVNLVRNAAEAIRSATASQHREATLHQDGSLQHHDAGHIHLTLDVVDGTMRFTVEDNGPGLPPAVAAAFLSRGTLPVQAGRGLGHRIVRELVETTGGRLSIRVRPGRGTAFCVRWPLCSAEGSAPC